MTGDRASAVFRALTSAVLLRVGKMYFVREKQTGKIVRECAVQTNAEYNALNLAAMSRTAGQPIEYEVIEAPTGAIQPQSRNVG